MRKKITVRVHKAFFVNSTDKRPYFFITIRNDSKKVITIQDVYIYYKDTNVHILNEQRPLPFVLMPGKVWETWVVKETFKNVSDTYVYNKVQVKISINTILWSEEDMNVAPSSAVPDGK